MRVSEPDVDRIELLVSESFRPGGPIDRRDLFAGRSDQVGAIRDAIVQPGQHVVVYGERGVGKTSISAVIPEFVAKAGETLLAPRANCDAGDDFNSIWRKALEEISIAEYRPMVGFGGEPQQSIRNAVQLLGSGSVTPGAVRKALTVLGSATRTVVVFDEFDRIADQHTRTLFADTIKTLSDHLVPATVVIVGVADTVEELIVEHPSTERALVQVHMPRMTQAELEEIVSNGLRAAGMTIRERALRKVTNLAQGLPYYPQLLGQLAARVALRSGRLEVGEEDADRAIRLGVERSQESVIRLYQRATQRHRDNRFVHVLLGCALADSDEFGFFAPVDVREPLSRIMGRYYDIPAFARHLNALCDQQRGPALVKRGASRRFRYRFANPLLQPYAIMKGIATGMIDDPVV